MRRIFRLFAYLMGVMGLIITVILVYFQLAWPPFSTENELVKYIGDGDIQKVEEMIHSGVDINKPGKWRGMMAGAKWVDGRTPLTKAAEANQLKIAEFLISKGADINRYDGYGQTPVHVSAQYGHYEFVKLLIQRKCNLTLMQVGNNYYYNALSNAAIIARNKKIVKLLLENGALLNNPEYVKKDIMQFINDSNDQTLITLFKNANKQFNLDSGADAPSPIN